jgi:hypothetical protein
MAKASTKTVLGDATADGAGEAAPWETVEVTPAADQELEQFVAPAANQWRRKLTKVEMLEWVAAQVRHNSADPDAFGESAFEQAVSAETIDELLHGKQETLKGHLTLDVILECHSIKFLPSTEKAGCPYFALIDVRTTSTGAREAMSVGGWMAVAQLARMHYGSVELPADSPFLGEPEGAGSWPREDFPHYFRIRRKTTANGEMNYLDAATGF